MADFTFNILTPFVAPVTGQLCTRGDIENIFGIPNVVKWAILSGNDPDTPAGQAEITNRVNWAIRVSSTDFNNAMRQQTRHSLPLTGEDAITWQTMVVATKAGLLLYQHLKPTQRGEDGRPLPDKYDGIFTWAEQQLNFVRAGKIRLDGATSGKGTNAPEVTHERSKGAYGRGLGGYGGAPLSGSFPYVG